MRVHSFPPFQKKNINRFFVFFKETKCCYYFKFVSVFFLSLGLVLKFLNNNIPNMTKCTELKYSLSMMKIMMLHSYVVTQLKWLPCKWGSCSFFCFVFFKHLCEKHFFFCLCNNEMFSISFFSLVTRNIWVSWAHLMVTS